MTPHVRPHSPESTGRAPGRGRLEGRRVLIVGGGQRVFDALSDPVGNGRAMSILYTREGAHVAVADRSLEAARETARLITDAGGRGEAIEADIRDETEVRLMIDACQSAMGGLDGMVLNVGVFGVTGLQAVSPAEWTDIFDVNVRGPMFCCRAALDRMDAGSSIVFISSVAALRPRSDMPAYESSKAALGGLMRHIAQAGVSRGIRANLVYPGLVDSPNGREAGAGRPGRSRSAIPFGRQATAWEIAYATLFFMSDESVYVTAQSIAVDSGVSSHIIPPADPDHT